MSVKSKQAGAKSNTNKKAPRAPKSAPAAPAPVAPVAPPVVASSASDALKGRIGARTHAIHAALIEAYAAGALLTTKQIVTRASELLGRPVNAAPSHLNTMRLRAFVERVNGAWRLTSEGAKLANVAPPK